MNGFSQKELEQMTPKQAITNSLFLEVYESHGEKAAMQVRKILREQKIDPTSPDFDKQNFLRQIEQEMK